MATNADERSVSAPRCFGQVGGFRDTSFTSGPGYLSAVISQARRRLSFII